MIEIMTPTAPSICPTALIISQFIIVTLAVARHVLNAQRPTSNAEGRNRRTGEGGITPPLVHPIVCPLVDFPLAFARCKRGEGGIRTLGSLLGYGALAKRCFRPLSHLTKIARARGYRREARISPRIVDCQQRRSSASLPILS